MVQQRAVAKSKRQSDRGAARLRSVTGTPDLEVRVAALERELEAARARIAELETARSEALNRIDWAIDSLHNLLEAET